MVAAQQEQIVDHTISTPVTVQHLESTEEIAGPASPEPQPSADDAPNHLSEPKMIPAEPLFPHGDVNSMLTLDANVIEQAAQGLDLVRFCCRL